MKCCINCFSEINIQSYIEKIDEYGDCDYCSSNNVNIADVAEMGEFIRECIMHAYEPIDTGTGAIYDHEIGEYSTEGYSLDELLEWEGIFSDSLGYKKSKKLLDDLISESGPSFRDMMDGEFDRLTNTDLVLKNAIYGQEITHEHISWKYFKHTCKHINRYFDLGGRKSARANLLSNLNELFKKMKIILPKEFILYRARIFEFKEGQNLENTHLLKEISPAPPNISKNNRMSPSGISYMYLADSIDTCLAEIKAHTNDNVLVGKFVTKRKLKILDFSIVPNFIKKSIFSIDYNHDDNWIGDFAKSFIEEISLPINDNEKEIEYVATQVLAEYIRKLGYSGIKYCSSLKDDSCNYVLFCSINPSITTMGYSYIDYEDYSIRPFTDWLNLKSVDYMKFNTTFKQTIQHDDKSAEYNKIKKERRRKLNQMSEGNYEFDLLQE